MKKWMLKPTQSRYDGFAQLVLGSMFVLLLRDHGWCFAFLCLWLGIVLSGIVRAGYEKWAGPYE